MKKDEIIVLLKEQLQLANEQLQQANATVSSLTTQVNELIERIKSLEELLVQKGIAIDKANRQNKALGKLVSGKKSERQEKNPQDSMTQEEFDKKKTEQAEKRKARKNNGAKRDMHYEMKEVHVTIDPVMDAGLLKTLRLFGTRTCIRYSMEPIKFIKTVYHINTYTDGSIMYPGKTPPALLLNSSYSPSFAAGLLQMRYIYSMPVERIIKYPEECGQGLDNGCWFVGDGSYRIGLRNGYVCGCSYYYDDCVDGTGGAELSDTAVGNLYHRTEFLCSIKGQREGIHQ